MPYISSNTGWTLQLVGETAPLGDELGGAIVKVTAASWTPGSRDLTLTFAPGYGQSTLVLHDIDQDNWLYLKFQGGF